MQKGITAFILNRNIKGKRFYEPDSGYQQDLAERYWEFINDV